MHKAPPGETKVVRGVTLRRDPAREACYQVVNLHEEQRLYDGMYAIAIRESVHRSVNQEVQTLEIAAQCLADFPHAAWELRLELARQCWDEARHAALYYRRLGELGGWKGEFPIANLDWSVVCMLDSLPARLAVQHRTYEAGSLDVDHDRIPVLREAGDEATADMIEAIEADEIQHVRFANEWLKRMAESEPRTVLQVASAMAWVKRVIVSTRPANDVEAEHEVPVNLEDRQLAGFSAEELAEPDQAGRPGTRRSAVTAAG